MLKAIYRKLAMPLHWQNIQLTHRGGEILAIAMDVLSLTPTKIIYGFETGTVYVLPIISSTLYDLYLPTILSSLPSGIFQVSERPYRSKIRKNGTIGSTLCLV